MIMTDDHPSLSICIVGINPGDYLRECLRSIYTSQIDVGSMITYVDNGSVDGTLVMLQNEFPYVSLIRNDKNLGYAKANNQAIRCSQSRFVLLLNPDTLLEQNSLQVLVDYLTTHPQVGIVGPKVLNSDGSFQPQCKRGEARPWEVICYFSGLSRLFPKDPRFCGYLQGHLDENTINFVPAISGSCMLIRREMMDKIGLLDEAFFAYQEDTDFCVRARQAGWQVVFNPEAHIIHYGGRGGTQFQPYRTIYEWHRSYFLYYKKHLARDYFFLFNWLFYLLMGAKLAFSLFTNLFRKNKYPGPKRN